MAIVEILEICRKLFDKNIEIIAELIDHDDIVVKKSNVVNQSDATWNLGSCGRYVVDHC